MKLSLEALKALIANPTFRRNAVKVAITFVTAITGAVIIDKLDNKSSVVEAITTDTTVETI